MNKKRGILLLLGLLLFLDIVFILLRMNQYYIVPFTKPPVAMIILCNIIVLGIILVLKKKIFVATFTTLILISIWVACSLWSSFMGYNYVDFQSPQHKQTIVVKYRVATLGESHYFFEFYQKSSLGFFMRKLEGQDYNVMLEWSQYASPEDVLGTNDVKWASEKEAVFDTAEGEWRVTLK
ncbi:hypothetical protein EJP82_07600 [Paenibacillus anaericanus]|uniref:Uncharacterized protein n=1 Tax=Paenibacillus anaericanus TaxID=170367 RepID=A0A3S1BU56_9BACL|nr:hypothetical protein [Paenibacillus anaericanus]RUT47555.1 hypothetical protein EJP82_07600 [Paenibacillus anaericanus]